METVHIKFFFPISGQNFESNLLKVQEVPALSRNVDLIDWGLGIRTVRIPIPYFIDSLNKQILSEQVLKSWQNKKIMVYSCAVFGKFKTL
jgi:hypothetical protein